MAVLEESAVQNRKDSPITGRMAKWYDASTRSDMREFAELAHCLAQSLPEGSKVLEVAPGPGFVSIELAKQGINVTGIDLSADLVNIARKNAEDAGVKVTFLQGNASTMTLPSDTYDLIVCRAAFKNFGQPVEALNEMYRVLKPGGRALINDLRKDASMESITRYIKASGRSGMDALFTRLTFRFMLLRTAYTEANFEQMIRESDFEQFHIDREGISFDVWLTK